MKKLYIYISTFVVIIWLIRCNHDDSKSAVQHQEDFKLILEESKIKNPKLISLIKEYIDNNNGEPYRIYTMLVQRKDIISTSFQLSSIITYSELYNSKPSGYFMVDGNIILVYNGLEHLYENDNLFIEKLKNVIGDRIENNLLSDNKTRNPKHIPKMFNPSTWEVRIVQDSMTIEKGVFNLLGPQMVEKIKFIPPKSK